MFDAPTLRKDVNQQEMDDETKSLIEQAATAGNLPFEDESSIDDTCVKSFIAYLHYFARDLNSQHFLARLELQQQLMRQRLSFPERPTSGVLDPGVAEMARGKRKEVEFEAEKVIMNLSVPDAKRYAITVVKAVNEMIAVTAKFKQGALEVAAETRLAFLERSGQLR